VSENDSYPAATNTFSGIHGADYPEYDHSNYDDHSNVSSPLMATAMALFGADSSFNTFINAYELSAQSNCSTVWDTIPIKGRDICRILPFNHFSLSRGKGGSVFAKGGGFPIILSSKHSTLPAAQSRAQSQ
jgi:hypothetical protein